MRLSTANDDTVPVKQIGAVQLRLRNQHGSFDTVVLHNVCYTPTFSRNILSISRLWHENRLRTHFGASCYLKSTTGQKYRLDSSTSPYILGAHAVFSTSLHSTASPAAAEPRSYAMSDAECRLWHARFMHSGSSKMRLLAQHIPRLANYRHLDCDACLQGGAVKRSIRARRSYTHPNTVKSSKIFTKPGERISTDLCGPFPTGVADRCVYAIVFHDAFSKHIAVYCLETKTKEEVLDAFKRYLTDFSEHFPSGIKEFHADNGGEFINSDMDAFCEELCIKRSFTVPYLPSQNPYAERAWGTVLRKVRTSLFACGLPDSFWTYAITRAAFIHNIIPAPDGITPIQKLTGVAPSYENLYPFGCKCYYLLSDDEHESKVSVRALPAVYLGRDAERKGDMVYIPFLKRITTAYHIVYSQSEYLSQEDMQGSVRFRIPKSRHVTVGTSRRSPQRPSRIYHEDRDIFTSPANCPACQGKHRRHTCGRGVTPAPVAAPPATHDDDDGGGDGDGGGADACDHDGCEYPRGHEGPHSNDRISGRLRSQDPSDAAFVHVVFDDVSFEVLATDLSQGSLFCPEIFEQATSGPDADKWWDSMDKEITALLQNRTWELVSRSVLPPGRKPTKSRWVYTLKYLRDGSLERRKSRFVVCGYSQIKGKDYERAFSATLRATSFRCLLAIASGRKLRLEHFDVGNAFTQAKLDDVEIWVEPPKGYDKQRDKHGTYILRLLKALYGTKQASLLWQQTLAEFLVVSLKFKRSSTDPCIFLLERDGGIIVLGIYVDDLVVAHNSKLFKWFTEEFTKRFESKHLGALSWFLGIAVDQDSEYRINLCQERFILNVLDKYIPHHKTSSVVRDHPRSELFMKLQKPTTDAERERMHSKPYMNVVGSLLYVAVMTRPDVCYHTSMLAKFMSDPSEEAFDLAINLLLYLKHNPSLKLLTYTGSLDVPIVRGKDSKNVLHKHRESIRRNGGFLAYSDSSWGRDVPYPMFGYCIYLFGGLVAFASKQLKVVAFSSCEAEYAAASYTCKEIEFIRNLCADMGFSFDKYLVLLVDNSATIDVAYNMGVTARTKHFNLCIHYIRDLTQDGRIVPAHILAEFQKADGMTKGLDKTSFLRWLSSLVS